jgi:hypothetical protein
VTRTVLQRSVSIEPLDAHSDGVGWPTEVPKPTVGPMKQAIVFVILGLVAGCDKGSGGAGGGATGASSVTTSGASGAALAAATASTGPIKECEDFWDKVQACMLDKALKDAKTDKDRTEAREMLPQVMKGLRATSSGGTDRGGRTALAMACKGWSDTFSTDTCSSSTMTH